MSEEFAIGYDYLVEALDLQAKPAPVAFRASSRVASMQPGDPITRVPMRMYPGDRLVGHLEFALRYEPPRFDVLAAFFDGQRQLARNTITEWLRQKPTGVQPRKAGYLFEWITGEHLDVPDVGKVAYTELLDGRDYVTSPNPARSRRFGVANNLLGDSPYCCPMIRRTDRVEAIRSSDPRQALESVRAECSEAMWELANNYFALSETQSTFQIEKEPPPKESRGRRFYRALFEAGSSKTVDESDLTSIQNLVVTRKLDKAAGYRATQNWMIRGGAGHMARPSYVPPAPGDLPDLMAAWEAWVRHTVDESARIHPVLFTAAASFAFVYLHPYLDGNGRVHRYLIHDLMVRTGVFDRETIVPVSAFIQREADRYAEVLQSVSNRIMSTIRVSPMAPMDSEPRLLTENPWWLYAFWDATQAVEFVGDALDQTLRHDIGAEMRYLERFHEAVERLESELDVSNDSARKLATFISQNGFSLSKTKRDRHFEGFSSSDISQAEAVIREVFKGENDDLMPPPSFTPRRDPAP